MGTRSNSGPPLDEDAIVELESGLPGGDLTSALRIFHQELEMRAARLESLVSTNDSGDLAALAHSLKGSAGTFCAFRLANAAQALEEELKARDPGGTRVATLTLSAELADALEHLRAFLERRSKERR